MMSLMIKAYGYVLAPGYDFGTEFDVGTTLILDGLERMALAEA